MQFSESGSCGVWFTNSDQFVDVPNLQVSITTSGGPVLIQLVATSTGSMGEPNGDIMCMNRGVRP